MWVITMELEIDSIQKQPFRFKHVLLCQFIFLAEIDDGNIFSDRDITRYDKATGVGQVH
jgi:hypothetical protein